MKKGDILIAACKDDCVSSLSQEAMNFFIEMGSRKLNSLKAKDNFSFIGVIGSNGEYVEASGTGKDNAVSKMVFEVDKKYTYVKSSTPFIKLPARKQATQAKTSAMPPKAEMKGATAEEFKSAAAEAGAAAFKMAGELDKMAEASGSSAYATDAAKAALASAMSSAGKGGSTSKSSDNSQRTNLILQASSSGFNGGNYAKIKINNE